MDLKTKIGGVILAVLALFGLTTGAVKVGSVGAGLSYQSTTTSATGFGGRQVTIVPSVFGSASAILGSVVISSTTGALPTTGTLRIMDATSTTDISSTTLASFPIQAVAGDYIFDSNAFRGIIVEAGTGFDGTYTITYRP